MQILIVGAGVIGATYGWKLSAAGFDVTLLVRRQALPSIRNAGISIRCRDERLKADRTIEAEYHPAVVDELRSADSFDLILVGVRAQQLEGVLPLLAGRSGDADVLFFGNNWWGDEIIRRYLPVERCLFGFSRLVGGWRSDGIVDCIFFDNPELVTLLGERDGQVTPRLQTIQAAMQQADLRPALSHDILGWLAIHYVEFLGVMGGILKAGSYDAFVSSAPLIKEAVLATRESLEVCKARGVDFKKAASPNIRVIESTPLFALAPLIQMQYRTPSIKQFFEENLEHSREELEFQYCEVLAEGRRLGVPMPHFSALEPFFSQLIESSNSPVK